MLDIWKIGAPALDLLCPDIYLPAQRDYYRIAKRYAREDNALFIPESATGGVANAMNAIYAVVELGAIGICGFGAENALRSDGTLTDDARTMACSMRAMMALALLLITYRGTGRVHAILQEESAAKQYLRLEHWRVEAKFASAGSMRGLSSTLNMRNPENRSHLEERGRAILIEVGEFEFFLAGAGVGLDFIRNGDESNYQLFVHGGQAVRIRLNPAMVIPVV